MTVTMAACSNTKNNTGGGLAAVSESLTEGASSASLSSYPSSSNSNFRVSLTDAPKKGLKSVNVNINHMELFIKKGPTEKRLIVGQNLRMVDLLTLQNGVLLPLEDIQMPDGIEISHIRLVLNNDNNHGIRIDGSRCEMKTPSGQQSGIKIILKDSIKIESNYRYSMVVDFDAEKSVVVRGNGSCLLKPVLKLASATKQLIPPPTPTPSDDTSSSNPDVPIVDGTDTNTTQVIDPRLLDDAGNILDPEALGFDVFDPSTYPDGITADDLTMYF